MAGSRSLLFNAVYNGLQYQAVYNILSFALASMMSTTAFLWFRSFAVKDQFKSAVLIFDLVTLRCYWPLFLELGGQVEACSYDLSQLVGWGRYELACTGACLCVSVA